MMDILVTRAFSLLVFVGVVAAKYAFPFNCNDNLLIRKPIVCVDYL